VSNRLVAVVRMRACVCVFFPQNGPSFVDPSLSLILPRSLPWPGPYRFTPL